MNSPEIFKNPCAICKKKVATLLCDYITEYYSRSPLFIKGNYEKFIEENTPKYETCDLPICEECAKNITDGIDFCPHHYKLHMQVELPGDLWKYQARQKEKTYGFIDERKER